MSLRPAPLRKLVYYVFRGLPLGIRAWLVRRLTPNYTVGAVVLLRDYEGQLLLLRQVHSQSWSLPGGLSARRERPIDTAARELFEEVGVRLDLKELWPAVPNALINPKAQQVDVVFTATVESDEVKIKPDEAEIVETKWYGLKELPPLTGPTARLLGAYGIGPRGNIVE